MQLYFIAIVPPANVCEIITAVKKRFSIHHQSSRALKSPSHITLRPPFKMFKEREEELSNSLTTFANDHKSFNVDLNGYGHFRKDVIYIKPSENDLLNKAYSDLQQHLALKNCFPISPPYPKFHPHITVAYRDLSAKAFDEAWKVFEHEFFKYSFTAGSIYLLKHIKQKWDVIGEFGFKAT